MALSGTGLSPDQVVHIGDSLSSDEKRCFGNGNKCILLEVFDTEFFNKLLANCMCWGKGENSDVCYPSRA